MGHQGPFFCKSKSFFVLENILYTKFLVCTLIKRQIVKIAAFSIKEL